MNKLRVVAACLAAIAVVCLGPAAVAQTVPAGYVLVNTLNLGANTSTGVVQNGTISYQPVNNLGQVISFRTAGGLGAKATARFGVTIALQSPGSGYSGSWTCTVAGGTFTSQATCTATVTGGGLVFALTSAGTYTAAPTGITFTGGTYVAGVPATVSTGMTLSGTTVTAGGSGYTVTTAAFPGCTGTISSSVTVSGGAVTAISASGGSCPGGTVVSIAGQGQVGPAAITGTVTDGVSSVLLGDSVSSLPANVCYAVTATDNVSGNSVLGAGYGCVQPAGSGAAISGGQAWCAAGGGGQGGTCTFDSYTPNLTNGVVTQTGPAGPTGPQGAPGAGSIPGLSSDSANGIAVTGATKATGVSDTAAAEMPSYLCSGSDEGARLQSCVNGFISSPGSGRAISETVPSKTVAVTWNADPFSQLLNSNGSVNISNVYQLAAQIQPWQTVTTNFELDMGQYSQVDCGDVYSAYDPALGSAGIIQPNFSAWSSSTTYGLGQFASAGGVNYVSLQAANLNEAPASQPTFWAVATTMMTMGPLSAATGTTLATQGAKISNCGLYSNGVTGTSAILNGCGQEGTKLWNLRITDFMVGIDVDQICTAPGSGHNFGIYDTQIEMNEGTDAAVWGLRYGFTAPTVQSGVAENISTIGGTNTTGIKKIGVEDDGGGLYLKSQWCESLTLCLLFNNLHSGRKDGSHYSGITMAAANAPVFAVAEDGGAAADSYFLSDIVAGDVASNIFIDKEQPTAAIEKLAGEEGLTEYVRSTPNTGIQAQPCIWTTTAQAASVNCPVGNSFENVALWPALLLPARLSPLTYSGAVTNGTKFMTTSDRSGGIVPFGVALNGDLAAATTSTHHSVSVVTRGIAPIFMDGATTAGDVVVLSSAAVAGTAIGGHDSGSASLPTPGTVYLGYVRRTVAAIPSTPSAPTVTTNCTSACATTWTYEWTIRNSADPADQTTSAPSSTGTVSGPSTLSTASGGANQGFNSITAPTGCSLTTPCDLYRTVGGVTGFVGEYHSTSTVTDKGMIGNGLLPVSTGMIAPPVDIQIGVTAGSSLATSSAPGLAQCDGTTITCSSGIISTAAGSILSHWWNGGGNVATGTQAVPVSSANTQYPQNLEIPAQVNFARMCVDVTTADATGGDVYNFALVKLTTATCTGAGCATTTLANWTAATALAATGLVCVANAQGSVTVPPGNYFLISTGNANTARIAGTSSTTAMFSSLTASTQAGTSTGGAFGTITLNVLANSTVVNSGAAFAQVALGLTQ